MDIEETYLSLRKRVNDHNSWNALDQLRESSFEKEILRSGNPQLIADYYHNIDEDLEKVEEHFGLDSLEALAFINYKPYKEHSPESFEIKKYIIPGRAEDPSINKSVLKRWIADFHYVNGMTLPKGFHQRNHQQLKGMFNGMLNTYKINFSDIYGE